MLEEKTKGDLCTCCPGFQLRPASPLGCPGTAKATQRQGGRFLSMHVSPALYVAFALCDDRRS